MEDKRRKFTEVIAETMDEARDKVVAAYDREWAFLYTAQEFEGQIREYGLTLLETLE
jgi:hypothetical protein